MIILYKNKLLKRYKEMTYRRKYKLRLSNIYLLFFYLATDIKRVNWKISDRDREER